MTCYDELVARGLIAQVTDEKRDPRIDQQWKSGILYWL